MNNNKLKPFNLESALQGKPVVTRDGRKVKIGAYNPDALTYRKIVGWIGEDSCSWADNGDYYPKEEHRSDLFMAAETVTRWVNVYDDGKIETGGTTYDTKEEAENNRTYIYGEYLGAYALTVDL